MPVEKPSQPQRSPASDDAGQGPPAPAAGEEPRGAAAQVCPVCGGTQLLEIRQKLHCQRCHAIVETCCEGGRG